VGSREVAAPAVPRKVAAAYSNGVRALWNTSGAVDGHGKPAPHFLEFSGEAERLMRDFERWLEPRLAEGEELSFLAGWASKLAGAAARLAGILHMAEVAEEGHWNHPVSPETVAAAIQLGRDYFLPHAQAAFSMMGANPKLDTARKVWATIATRVLYSQCSQSAPPSFTRSDAHQWNRRQFPGGVEELDPILDVLERHNLCRPVGGTGQPGRGHRSPEYEVNPAALAAFKKEAPRTDCADCTDSGADDG
jgi:hypothetical protein